ncbi:MAG: nitrogen fixation protein NifE [Eubacteriaceae bacterium]|nr:nitrogen fixation protein NifE [Eubacteriaceae bacterium]
MGLHRFKPMPSGRMGILWTVSSVSEAAVVEYGCMGHNLYSGYQLRQGGIYEGKGAPLYTTYIDETDIAMGDTARLPATIKQVIINDAPKVIFLQPSAVPEVVGTDMTAVANELREEFPEVILIPLGHGSFAISQHKGVEEALLTLVGTLPLDGVKTDPTYYNIIGSCADLFNYGADAREMIRMMRGAFNMEPLCVLSSDCSVTDIQNMGKAAINLVIRREGIPAAEKLKKRFGTPYVYGRPYGIASNGEWLRKIGEILSAKPPEAFIAAEEKLVYDMIDGPYRTLRDHRWSYPEEAEIYLGGHIDVVSGILKFATEEMPFNLGAVWCDCPEHAGADIPYYGEKEWIPIVKNKSKGYLMGSGEMLLWAGRNTTLQISNPDIGYRLHPYGAPFVGYRGAVNLVNVWINEYVLRR